MTDQQARLTIKPGIYRATFRNGGLSRPVAIVYGPTHRTAMIPLDGKSIILEIVEDNWQGLVASLTPLREQHGLSGAMYWDTERTIYLEGIDG